MAFVRLLLLLQLLLSTMDLTSREVKARNFASLFDREFFTFESIAAHDLIVITQEIQFLEFMDQSNSTQAHSNY